MSSPPIAVLQDGEALADITAVQELTDVLLCDKRTYANALVKCDQLAPSIKELEVEDLNNRVDMPTTSL